jgi:uncharacterized protein YwgA
MLLLAGGSRKEENEPIVGKTRLQKELFLSQIALREYGISGKYSFRPYNYGPYSREIYTDIEWLKRKTWITEQEIHSPQLGIIRKFLLTSVGISESKKLITRFGYEEEFQIISKIKRDYNSMDVVDLVEYTHQEFPEYVGQRN